MRLDQKRIAECGAVILMALKVPGSKLDKYSDDTFVTDIRTIALEFIENTLFDIHNLQLNDPNKVGAISKRLNQRDPLTGCTMLDYCLVAGFPELGMHLASMGARYSTNPRVFKRNVQRNLNTTKLDILSELLDTYDQIAVGMQHHIKNSPTKKSILVRARNYLRKDGLFPSILLLAGVACIIASPFAGGLGTILLLSIGIPSIITAISTFQATYNARRNRRQVASQAKLYFEEKEICKFKTMCQELRVQLRLPSREQILSARALYMPPKEPKSEHDNSLIFMLKRPTTRIFKFAPSARTVPETANTSNHCNEAALDVAAPAKKRRRSVTVG
jgi:hypothetical protein